MQCNAMQCNTIQYSTEAEWNSSSRHAFLCVLWRSMGESTREFCDFGDIGLANSSRLNWWSKLNWFLRWLVCRQPKSQSCTLAVVADRGIRDRRMVFRGGLRKHCLSWERFFVSISWGMAGCFSVLSFQDGVLSYQLAVFSRTAYARVDIVNMKVVCVNETRRRHAMK